MTEQDFKNIKLLSAKERLEKESLYSLTKEERNELERLKKDFDTLDNTVYKTVFYMHDFLGIDFTEIAEIINYTYQSARNRYYEAKSILIN